MKTKCLLAALLIAFAACKTKEKKENLQVEVAPQDTVAVAETPAPSPLPVEEVDRRVNLDDRYFLVINSYTVKEFAEARNKQYQEKGYLPAVIMRNNDGYYRLAIESYNDLDKAKEALERLRQNEEFRNTWIMVIKR